MLAAVHGLPVLAVVVVFVAIAGWVLDQTLSDVREIRRRQQHR